MRRQIVTALAVVSLFLAAVIVATQLRLGPTAAQATSGMEETRKLSVKNETLYLPTSKSPLNSSEVTVPAAIKVADPAFQKWLSSEAKTMDQPSVDGPATQKRMAKIVRELTPAQSHQLLETVRRAGAPAGEKILATYLLVQAGPRALNDLQALITTALDTKGPQEAHSVGEMEAVREKTLRIMALDGLSSRAQTDPAARGALAQAIAEIQDPYIKSYAQERYRRLPAQ